MVRTWVFLSMGAKWRPTDGAPRSQPWESPSHYESNAILIAASIADRILLSKLRDPSSFLSGADACEFGAELLA